MTALDQRLREHFEITAANIPTSPLDPAAPVRRARRRRRNQLAAAAFGVMLAIAGIGIALLLSSGDMEGTTRTVDDPDDAVNSTTTVTTTTTTTASDEPASETFVPPAQTSDLAWTPEPRPATVGLEHPTWTGYAFASISSAGLWLAEDGANWVREEALPDELDYRGVAGWDESIVVRGQRVGANEIWSSHDAGDSWEQIESSVLEPRALQDGVLSVLTTISGLAVLDETVLVTATQRVVLDSDRALQTLNITEGSYPAAYLHYPGGEDLLAVTVVHACTDAVVPYGCLDPEVFSLDDVGVDASNLWRDERPAIFRSVGRSPLEQVAVDGAVPEATGNPSAGLRARVGIVDDQFYIGSVDPDLPIFNAGVVNLSADGTNWTSRSFGGSPWSLESTGQALFAMRDGGVIRSTDLGVTWDPVVIPPSGAIVLAAGPGGVVLSSSQPLDDGSGSLILAWSRDGTTFEWETIADSWGVNGSSARQTVTSVAVGEGALVGLLGDRASGSNRTFVAALE